MRCLDIPAIFRIQFLFEDVTYTPGNSIFCHLVYCTIVDSCIKVTNILCIYSLTLLFFYYSTRCFSVDWKEATKKQFVKWWFVMLAVTFHWTFISTVSVINSPTVWHGADFHVSVGLPAWNSLLPCPIISDSPSQATHLLGGPKQHCVPVCLRAFVRVCG